MAALPKTTYRDAGKPAAAGPLANGGTLPGAAIPGEAAVSPSHSPIDDIAAALVFTDATGKRDCWNESARQFMSGLLRWRSDATGFYE
jgi:hypothetical protein